MNAWLIVAIITLALGAGGVVGGYRWADSHCDAREAKIAAQIATAQADLADKRASALEKAVVALSNDLIKQSKQAAVEDRVIREQRRADPTCEDAWNAKLHACIADYVRP